jgi:hypothetical protein
MSIPTTWTTLKAELATLAIRDDLEDLIPNFIGYAESWMRRELRSPEREATATLSITDGVAAMPSDFQGVLTVYVDGDVDVVLDQMTPQRLRAMFPTTTTGTPRYFAVDGETVLFGPWPASGTVVIMDYLEGIPRLSASQATNWVLTDHPDLYVFACLAEIADYTRDPDEANRWRSKAFVVAESVNKQGRARKTNSGPLMANSPVGQVSAHFKC